MITRHELIEAIVEAVSVRSKARLLRRVVGKKNVYKVHGGPSPNYMQDPMDYSFRIPPEASRWKTPRRRMDRIMHNIEHSRLMRKMKGRGMTDNQIRGIERAKDTARLRPWRKRGVTH